MWFSLPNMRARWGDGAALAVARAAEEAVAGIGDFCEEQGVDAWFRRAGYLQVSTAPAHDGVWAEALCRLPGAGGARRDPPARAPPRSPPAAPRRPSAAAPSIPDAATVQPARLALGLRDRLRASGVEICEGSPVESLADGPDGVVARTAAGVVRAGAAVLAIGPAAKAPRAPLRNALTVTSSHIVLTEPVPDLLEEIGWTGGECITDARLLIDYFRTTPDGRILFGWGGGRIAMGARLGGRGEVDTEVVARTAARLREYFPGLREAGGERNGKAGARLTHAWGGPIDASPTHLPMVVPLPGGHAFVAAGYTGNGVGPSHMVGRTLASLALDRRDEHSRLAFVDPSPRRVPPEPFHRLGGETIRRALMRKEEAELAGRDPGPLSRAIAAVPKLIGIHIGRSTARVYSAPACARFAAGTTPGRSPAPPTAGATSPTRSPSTRSRPSRCRRGPPTS